MPNPREPHLAPPRGPRPKLWEEVGSTSHQPSYQKKRNSRKAVLVHVALSLRNTWESS